MYNLLHHKVSQIDDKIAQEKDELIWYYFLLYYMN